jgi:hypothetical protein
MRRATQLLGTVVPERVLDALRDVPAGEPSAVYLTGGPRDILRANLRALPTWRARLTLLHEMSMPPPAFMRTAHAGANRWTLPWLYLRRAWRGFARSRRP